MKSLALKIWLALLAIGSIAVTLAISGAMATLVHTLGLWSYGVSFTMNIGSFAIVYLVPLPEDGESDSRLLARFLHLDKERFTKGIWPWVMRRGTPFFVVATAVILGPFPSAILVRFLAMNERLAWRLALVSSFFATVIWVSFYLGITERLVVLFS